MAMEIFGAMLLTHVIIIPSLRSVRHITDFIKFLESRDLPLFSVVVPHTLCTWKW